MRTARATVKDVAARAGVSPKTVSNVVTGTVAVRPETRARVEDAMRALDFVPNLSARGLRSGRSGTIAVALPDLSTEFSAELLHFLVESAHERGLAVQIDETAHRPQRERDLLSRARDHLVDGLILNPIRLEDSAILRGDDLPPAVVIGEVEQNLTDHVRVDSRRAARDITRLLIDRGARRIAAIGGDERSERATATSRVRLAGYREALAEAGIAHDPRLEANVMPWSMSGGAEAMGEVLQRGVGFDAVVAFTDAIAVGALGALAEAGMRVPDDVLVSGFDDVEIARFARPALTTVSFDRRAFAEAALELLEARIADPARPIEAVVVAHRVVERESTGASR
jgi:DNA-binding LacI/PurR family transcriptional regulator